MREVPPTAGLALGLSDFVLGSRSSFEQSLASLLEVPAPQIECSGTAALIVALTALKRSSSRRRVILPAYTCPLVALAVLHSDLEPVLCDLLPSHFGLDPERLSSLCDRNTLAIIATHLGGRVTDLNPVVEIARRDGVSVIEDAAQSMGATWHDKPVGMIGDAGFYSLAVGKGLSIFEGGVLMAREQSMRQQLLETSAEIIPSSYLREFRRALELLAYAVFYRPSGLGLAYGLPLRRSLKQGKLIEAVGDDFSFGIPLHRVGNWRKAVGTNALQRLPAFIKALRLQAQRRIQRIVAIPDILMMTDALGGQGVWPFFMILMPSSQARDSALDRLWTAGLGVSRLYIHALPDYPYLKGKFSQVEVPNASDFAARMLTVSNSPWLDEEGFEQICKTLEQCVNTK